MIRFVAAVLLVLSYLLQTVSADVTDSEECETVIPLKVAPPRFGNLQRMEPGQRQVGSPVSEPPQDIVPFALRATAAAIALQPDGKMVVAGTAGYDLALIRYNTDGSLDSTFGTAGIITTRAGVSLPQQPSTIDIPRLYFDTVSSLKLQADGKIIIGGSAADANPANTLYPDRRFFMARLNASGRLDDTFGKNGKSTPYFSTGGMVLASLPDDKILAAMGSIEKLSLVRLHSIGLVDLSFGDNGVVNFTPQALPIVDSLLERILPNRKPSLAVLRTIDSWQPEFALLRYTRSGASATMLPLARQSSDQFGSGRGAIAVGGNQLSLQTAKLIKDGQVVVGGFVSRPDGRGEDAALARYNQEGTVDLKFGTAGIASVSYDEFFLKNKQEGLFYDSTYYCRGFCQVIEQDDGKIVAAASQMHRNFALVRFLVDGTRDPSFGTNGKILTSIGSQGDIAGALALQPDGKIVLAGTCGNALHTNIALIRYNIDGSLDSTFGRGGKVTTRVGPKIYDRSLFRVVAPLSFIAGM